MATITIQPTDTRYIYVKSQYQSSKGGYYGNMSDILAGWSGNYAYCLMQFNVEAVSCHKVTKVTLVETRKALYDNWQSSVNGGVYATINAFISKNANDPSLAVDSTFADVQYSLLSGGLSVTNETTIGVIERDITSFFDISQAQKNLLGVIYRGGLTNTIYSDSSYYLKIEYEMYLCPAPTNLLPTATQNPKGPITLSWWTNLHTDISDPQTGARLIYWQGSGTRTTIDISGTTSTYTLPANTFTSYTAVSFTVATITQYNGVGTAASGSFSLAATPPNAPTLVYPIGIAVTATNGVALEWVYSSPYDTTPSRFDIRYRIDGGSWITGSTTALSFTTQAVTYQAKIDWQVMAYGRLGDAGAWSDTTTFYTIGAPGKPTIVSVTSSNRPTINFSATNLMAWQIQVFSEAGNIVYDTEYKPFLGAFSYRLDDFLPNGRYTARMRIVNEHGIESEWGTLPFIINATAQTALNLHVMDNLSRFIRLRFNNNGRTVFVYRKKAGESEFKRIGKTMASVFDDYSASPGVKYFYFVRVINSNFDFVDSNIDIGVCKFLETIICPVDNPENSVDLLVGNGKPKKEMSFSIQKSLLEFAGRDYPVMLRSNYKTQTIAFSFYIDKGQLDKLQELEQYAGYLQLRDWRYGTIVGHFSPNTLQCSNNADGYIISFAFVRLDYDVEVGLD